ncbi:SDR family NAD(P)-dependent oxidoreductase [Sinomonas terrae]|uniref:SDR family oxidoreductase n=1 Tax=Sinomonas terrae TaxID=2908838 RepID=A0ABS9U7H0_9MICC|nr:SDR family oxidoreductase [Sinomonas terrae]MCH6472545.1 SDR family oxidoreductase [Sinomonas terrae]
MTGGSGDIGSHIVRSLRDRGVRVASADIKPKRDSHLDGADGSYRFDEVDLSDSQAVEEWIAAVVQAWGVPTIGVLAAGISGASRLVETKDQEWRGVLASCLDSAFFTARSLITRMVAASVPGRIVTVGSWAAHAPHPHIGSYSVAKAGMRMLMRTLALDHASDGILVNEVAPGIVEAGLSKALLAADEELKDRTLEAIPTGKTLNPEQVTRDVLHLCSPLNVATTGAVLVSDGGLSLASLMNRGHRAQDEGEACE